MIKKLLDTSGGNTKLAKTNKEKAIRYAGLTLYPNRRLCPGSKAAGCMEACLKSAGRGRFASVKDARIAKGEYYENDTDAFLTQLRKELTNFSKLCSRQGVQGVVRLNVLSDVAWENHDIPQEFPELKFLDYTKRANRLVKKDMPSNYKLMFSYSGREQYRKSVDKALTTDRPMAVVFRNEFPITFMGREVVDGDESDWYNVNQSNVVVGLVAKGDAKHDQSGFVV